MANIEDFDKGARILQQVDVSEIFTSLALGIAEAQKKLDDNSISQLIRLSEQEINGKSLLELGFVPAFYSFTYADISASINLKMALKTSFALDVALSAEYDSGKQGKDNYSNVEKEKAFESEKSSYKSSRKFIMNSDSKKAVIINDNHFELDDSIEIVSRIDAFHSQLLQAQDIERVNFAIRQDFVTHFQTPITYTILKVLDLTSSGNNVTYGTSNSVVLSDKNFPDVFSSTTGKYGFSANQIYGLAVSPTPIELFFGFDKRAIKFDYSKGGVTNTDKEEAFDALASILREDSSLRITIEGHTDSSGTDSYNGNLSKDRCKAMREWFVKKGIKPSQIVTLAKGETLARSNNGPDETRDPDFRKVSITLEENKHYIYYITVFTLPATQPSPNHFINASATSIIESSTEDITNFEKETQAGIDYYLDKKTEIEFSAYSKTSEEIDIRSEQEEGSEDNIKVAQNESSKERLSNFGSNSNSDKTVALSGSIDLRMSKQFEMSVEGNSSMSARMVAAPPPTAFLEYISNTINEE